MRLLALALLGAAALAPARFAPRPGWHAGAGKPTACPGVSASRCSQATSWASTTPWRGCTACLPHKTIEALPPDGIALQISLATEDRPPQWLNRKVWPVRIRSADVVSGFEGVSARFGVFQHYQRVGRYEVTVWGFFGRARPTAAQLRAANAELAAARLPR